MQWLRSHLQFGSRLALFALALQFALSFGHIHLDGFAPASASAVARLAAAVDGHPLATTLPDDQNAPAKQKHSGQADDFCAICSLLNMANTLVPAASAILPLAAITSDVWFDLRASREHATLRPEFFRARAPPIT